MPQAPSPDGLCRKMRGKKMAVKILVPIISDFGKPMNQGCGGFV
jgi:hypothetical protein